MRDRGADDGVGRVLHQTDVRLREALFARVAVLGQDLARLRVRVRVRVRVRGRVRVRIRVRVPGLGLGLGLTFCSEERSSMRPYWAFSSSLRTCRRFLSLAAWMRIGEG